MQMSELLKTLPTRQFYEKEMIRTQKVLDAARQKKHHLMKKHKQMEEVLSEVDARAIHATACNMTDHKIEAYLFWRRLWTVSTEITDYEKGKVISKVCRIIYV